MAPCSVKAWAGICGAGRAPYLLQSPAAFKVANCDLKAAHSSALSQGRIDNNEAAASSQCKSVSKDPKFDRAVEKAISEIGAPKYNIWAYPSTATYALGARNCQSWAADVLRRASEIQKP